MQQLPDALAPLAQYRQFIVYQLVPDTTRPGKTHKYPLNPHTGRHHNAHDPAIWLDVETAIRIAAAWNAANTDPSISYGVGFTFTAQDPFFFFDLDECLVTGEDGTRQWTPIVAELCTQFNGAAVEISQSGRGLHIIGTGEAPSDRKIKDKSNKIFDLYTEKRFCALTGTGIVGNAATVHTPALYALVDKYLRYDMSNDASGQDWTTGPCLEWYGPTDDEVLINRAMQSHSAASAFGNKASFADLWTNNVDVLAKAYPPDRPGDQYNASTVDSALAQHLSFWTGKDCERIKRLMLRSALVRDKWIKREENYLEPTILKVVARQTDVLKDKLPEPLAHMAEQGSDEATPDGEPPRAKPVTGATILSIEEQINLFKGCVYVVDQHRVLAPGGVLIKPEQFKVVYGGYTLPLDAGNERSTRDAWEAFTQSQSYRCPRADGTTFRPDRAAGEIIKDAGRTRVNVWWPIDVPRKVGDPGPFLWHLEKVLPNARDREILLSYMAACVQHKGVKFQWAPLLQGVEGNGKTLFTRCVAEAVGRRYTHWPKASKLAKEFNAWMLNKLFYGVEDIYVPDSKREVIEELKPMITGGDGLEIEGKGVDQISADVCGNFMFNSNHKDAIRKTRNDRRFGVFYTAQQCAADILAAGMGGDYFPRLYVWLRTEGYAIVSELLHTMPINPEFNPAGLCQRAPITTSTEQAIEAGMGGVEQEILEAVEQGTPGFAGGWISSMAVDDMLERLNAARRIPMNKRRELLVQLGYDWHPGLHDGRVNNTVFPDGGKPRLFIKHNHPHRLITSPVEIAQAYTLAQGPAGKIPV